MKKEETITIRISAELKKELKELAEKDRRKLSDFIHKVLEDYTKRPL